MMIPSRSTTSSLSSVNRNVGCVQLLEGREEIGFIGDVDWPNSRWAAGGVRPTLSLLFMDGGREVGGRVDSDMDSFRFRVRPLALARPASEDKPARPSWVRCPSCLRPNSSLPPGSSHAQFSYTARVRRATFQNTFFLFSFYGRE